MHIMNRDEALAFLDSTVHTGHLATTRKDGRPHVATIWFILDRETNQIVFTTRDTSVKFHNLVRNGYAALSVTDDIAPYTHVALEGTVITDDDPALLRQWATTSAGKYMGADRAEELGAQNGAPGEVVCRLTITRINGMSSVTD